MLPPEQDRPTPLDRRTSLPDGIPGEIGAYQLIRLLGQGGWGVVLEARHRLLGQRVAVKLLRPSLVQDAHFVDRFQREIAAIGRLEEHPNLVRARHAGEEDGSFYLVMDFVEGADLDRLTRRVGRLGHAEACEVIRQAALGVAAIARAGLVHRDLKPSNLMLTPDGTVKVMDLGLARLRDRDGPDGELTPSNVQMGTFDYQAPEQATDPRRVDARADVYGLGCTLFRLMTGRAPFADQGTPAGKIYAHAHLPLPALGEDVPAGLRDVLDRMTAKQPDARFASPDEVAEALRPFADGADLTSLAGDVPDSAREISTVADRPHLSVARTPSLRPVRWRGRAAVGLLGAVLAAALAGVLYGFWTRPASVAPDGTPDPPDPAVSKVVPPADPILAAGTVPRALDELTPYETHPLLDRAPVQAHWDPADGAFRTYLPDRRHLIVNAPRQAVFHLGTIRRPSYVFEAQVKQSHWTRGAGIFLGYRSTADGATFQYLLFAEKTRGDRRIFSLHRGRCTIRTFKGAPDFTWSDQAKEEIEAPRQNAHVTVEVAGHTLLKVRVNGAELNELTTRMVNAKFTEDDHRGCLGVVSRANSCVFHQASVTTQPDR